MSRVALVTGASSGLGEGLALRLAAEGWDVGLMARRRPLLEALAGRIREAGAQAAVLPCDVADRSAVAEAVARCGAELGPVGLAVANAGISGSTLIQDDPDFGASVEHLLRVNFLGMVYTLEAVLPSMLERGRGHLVGVGSLAGFRGLPTSAAYSASKAAMAAFLESLRLDLAGTGVDVTLIRPGYVRTPLTDNNDHAMPFLMDLDPALDVMMRAIRRRRRSVMFPWPLARLAWLGQVFPDRWYDALASRVRREKKGDSGGAGGG